MSLADLAAELDDVEGRLEVGVRVAILLAAFERSRAPATRGRRCARWCTS